jgi:Tfp pilus assembly protein PilO
MNRRLLIPLGIGVAIVALWFLALWGPQGKALSDARKRKNDAQQQTATLRDQLTRLQQARRDQPLKQSQLETLRVAIPDDPNLAQFILDANDAASRSGIDFLSITPTPPAAQGATTTPTTPSTPAGAPAGGGAAVPIRIAMNVSGGYFQVLDFINRLNRLPRIVVIDGVNMATQGTTTQLQVSLQERIFTTSSRPVGGTTGGGAASGGATPGATTTTTPGGTTTTTASGGATTTTRAGGA